MSKSRRKARFGSGRPRTTTPPPSAIALTTWKDQNGTADFVKLNSAEFVMIIGHLKEFLKLTFRALSLRESEWRSCL